MPAVWKPPHAGNVAAVLCADCHFSHKPPSVMPDPKEWYTSMARVLGQLHELTLNYDCPLVIAGDLLHHWDEPAELINFLIPRLSFHNGVYSVYGQHDLPMHAKEELHRSAYTTLIESGTVRNITPGDPSVNVGAVGLHGFPFGEEITPLKRGHDLAIEVAVIHKYCWIKGKSYPNAPAEGRARKWNKNLEGYDIALTGDNHIPFSTTLKSGCKIFNPGVLMRRRTDELNTIPSVGLLHMDKTITRHYLYIPKDCYIVQDAEEASDNIDMGAVVAELTAVQDQALDFISAVHRALDACGAPDKVKRKVLESLPGKGKPK